MSKAVGEVVKGDLDREYGVIFDRFGSSCSKFSLM